MKQKKKWKPPVLRKVELGASEAKGPGIAEVSENGFFRTKDGS